MLAVRAVFGDQLDEGTFESGHVLDLPRGCETDMGAYMCAKLEQLGYV